MGSPYDPWRNPEFARHRPKPVQRAWQSGRKRVFSVLLITAGLYAVWSLTAGQRGIVEIAALGREEARLRGEIVAADARLVEVNRKLENIELTIEERARVDYGYVEPNELVFVDSVTVGLDSAAVGTARGGGPQQRP